MGTIALFVIVGAGLIGLGAATQQTWLPMLRDAPDRLRAVRAAASGIADLTSPPSPERLARQSFLGGWMATWGSTAAERDAALTRRAPTSDEPPPAP